MSFSLHSLKGVMKGDKGLYRVQGLESKLPKRGVVEGTTIGVMKGDTRILDYS